jgi:serine/threonine-protein kinase
VRLAPKRPDRPSQTSRRGPWSESEAVITSTDGIATVVSAESLGNCISSSKELTLASGQSIGFEKMRAFELTRDNPKPTLLITLLNGKTVQGTMNMGCEIVGNNELGRFNLPYEKVRRVEFKR